MAEKFVTLEGMKSFMEGLKASGVKAMFTGTESEWAAMTDEEKGAYSMAFIYKDSSEAEAEAATAGAAATMSTLSLKK